MGKPGKTTPSWIKNKREKNRKIAADKVLNQVKRINQDQFAENMRFAPTRAEAKMHNAMIDVLKDTSTEVLIQQVIGPFIADMRVKNLIIEIDGSSHNCKDAYDARRTRYIQNCGYRVIRFTNQEVLSNAIECAKHIRSLTEPHQHKSETVRITYCPPSTSFPNMHKSKKRHFIIGWSA